MIYRLSVLAQRGYLGKCFGKLVCVDWDGVVGGGDGRSPLRPGPSPWPSPAERERGRLLCFGGVAVKVFWGFEL